MIRFLKRLPLLFALCACCTAFSQPFVPFLNRSQWFVNGESGAQSTFDWYAMGRDSVLNGATFRHVLIGNAAIHSYAREDVQARKAWVASNWDGWSERLLYDFNLVQGDSADLYFRYSGQQRFVVSSVDSVNTTQGFLQRINLINAFGGAPAALQWVEGVGELQHPFYLDFLGDAQPEYHLICNYQDAFKLYDDGFGNCPNNPPVVGKEEALVALEGLRIFPNPVHDVLWVEVPAGKGVWVLKVRNLAGRVLMARTLQAGSLHPLETVNWPVGMYLVEVFGPGGIVVRKLVK